MYTYILYIIDSIILIKTCSNFSHNKNCIIYYKYRITFMYLREIINMKTNRYEY